jgi:hypothetical protein
MGFMPKLLYETFIQHSFHSNLKWLYTEDLKVQPEMTELFPLTTVNWVHIN